MTVKVILDTDILSEYLKGHNARSSMALNSRELPAS
jgi:hypothetical protein